MVPSRSDSYGHGPAPASAMTPPRGSGGGGGTSAAAAATPAFSPPPLSFSAYHQAPTALGSPGDRVGSAGGGGGSLYSSPGPPYPLQIPRALSNQRPYDPNIHQDHGQRAEQRKAPGRLIAAAMEAQAPGRWGVMPHSPQDLFGQSPRGRMMGVNPSEGRREISTEMGLERRDERDQSIPFANSYSARSQSPQLLAQVEQRQQQQQQQQQRRIPPLQRQQQLPTINPPFYGGGAIYPWNYESQARASSPGRQLQYGNEERYNDHALARNAEHRARQPQPYDQSVVGAGRHLWLPSYPDSPRQNVQGTGNILNRGAPVRFPPRTEDVDNGANEDVGKEGNRQGQQGTEDEEMDMPSESTGGFLSHTKLESFGKPHHDRLLAPHDTSRDTAAKGGQASPNSDTMRNAEKKVAEKVDQKLSTKSQNSPRKQKKLSGGANTHKKTPASDIMVNQLEKNNDRFGDSNVVISGVVNDPTNDDMSFSDSQKPADLSKQQQKIKDIKKRPIVVQEKPSGADEEMVDKSFSPRNDGQPATLSLEMWKASERLLDGSGVEQAEKDLAGPSRAFFRRPGLKEEILEELEKNGKGSEKIVNIITALHRVAEHVGLNEGTYRHEAFVPLFLFSPPEGLGRSEILSLCAKLGTVSSPEGPTASAEATYLWNNARKVFLSSLISNCSSITNRVLLKSKTDLPSSTVASKKDVLFRINWGLVGPCARVILPPRQYAYIFHEFKSVSGDFTLSYDTKNAKGFGIGIDTEVLGVKSPEWKKHLDSVKESNVKLAVYRKRSIKVNQSNMVVQVGPSVAEDVYLNPCLNNGGPVARNAQDGNEGKRENGNQPCIEVKLEGQSSNKRQKRDQSDENGSSEGLEFASLPAVQKSAIVSLRKLMLKNKKPWMSFNDISKLEIDCKKHINENILVQQSTVAQANKESESNHAPFLRRKAMVQKGQYVSLFKVNREWRSPEATSSVKKQKSVTFSGSTNSLFETAKAKARERISKMCLDDLRDRCRKILGIEAGILRQKGITRDLLVEILQRDRSPFLEMLIQEECEKSGVFKVRSWLESCSMINLREIAHKFFTAPRSMIVARGITREYLIDLILSDTICGVPVGSKFVESFLAENNHRVTGDKTVKFTSISGESILITGIDSFVPPKTTAVAPSVEAKLKVQSPVEKETLSEFLPPHKSKWPETSSMGCARAQGYRPTQSECDRKWSKATLQRRCWLAVASKGPQAHWTGLIENLYPFEEHLSMSEPPQANAIRRSIKRTIFAGNDTAGWKTSGRRLSAGVAAQAFQQFKRNRRKIVLRPSAIDGLGVFSLEAVNEGEPILEYTGEVVRLSVADIREHEYEKGGAAGDCYMFRVDKDFVVDATTKGGIARFVNHSCSPTCSASIVAAEGHRRIMLFAARPIAPGEEITYDYKFGDEWGREKLRCQCGAPSCRKSLN